MARIFWDTNLFVYLVEGGSASKPVVALRRRMVERDDELFTSTLTLGELLVAPLARQDDELQRLYERTLREHATLLSFDQPSAIRFSQIRQNRTIKAPDAIQLACAAQARVDLFVTNDDRLSRAVVPGVHFITSLERAFL
jgi:predicted nucleic acid-binding protein